MQTGTDFIGSRRILIGCAGWNIPRTEQHQFPEGGSHLERYASVLPAVEINSSFYRPHRRATYARWAGSVPAGFRFAVKVPKAITHGARLADTSPELLNAFLGEVGALGDRLGALLVQLPPSLRFDAPIAGKFFRALRARLECDAGVVCEPRHPSWFQPEADALLAGERIARVAADPAPAAGAAEPGGWPGLVYYRLHGSPKRYYSTYPEECLQRLARRLGALSEGGVPVWCVFDNTAAGAALPNALTSLALVTQAR